MFASAFPYFEADAELGVVIANYHCHHCEDHYHCDDNQAGARCCRASTSREAGRAHRGRGAHLLSNGELSTDTILFTA